MSPLATVSAFATLSRSQWLGGEQLRRLQQRKLRRLLHHAYQTVPFWRRRFDEAGFSPDAFRTLTDLQRLPVTTKQDLQALAPQEYLSGHYPPERLHAEHTSGSTGQPFTIRLDPHFRSVRDALFLRALSASGYRFGQRLMLVTATRTKPAANWRRWLYASIEEDGANLLEHFNRFRPAVLYGCVTPLREMARAARHAGVHHRPQVIITTAESLDPATRRLLASTFSTRVTDVYGLTETGMVAWECPHAGYHLSDDTMLAELLPTDDGTGQRLVVTNLELFAMPLIRFQTGDLVTPGHTGRCACGRSLTHVEQIEGRLADCIQTPDGRSISPYRFTLALEAIPGLQRYQVLQTGARRYLVRIESDGADVTPIAARVRERMHQVLGGTAQVEVKLEAVITPQPGRKFRVVERRIEIEGVEA